MTPQMIIGVILAVAEAVREVFRWLQTPVGQMVVRKSLDDRAAWDRFWADVWAGLSRIIPKKLKEDA